MIQNKKKVVFFPQEIVYQGLVRFDLVSKLSIKITDIYTPSKLAILSCSLEYVLNEFVTLLCGNLKKLSRGRQVFFFTSHPLLCCQPHAINLHV